MSDRCSGPRRWRGRFEKALIIEHPDSCLDDELRACGIEPVRLEETPTDDELVRILQEGQHDLLFKRSRVLITEAVIEASQSLAAVLLCSIGDDSVDKVAAAKHGVLVINDPVSNGRSVAELIISEIISASRRIVEAVNETSENVWNKDNNLRFEVKGKKLGILGMGKIGRQVARLGHAMGMKILFHDTDEVALEVGTALDYTPVSSIGELFKISDILTVHVSAEDAQGHSNQDLVTAEHFAAMGEKTGLSPKVFLNMARGFLYPPEVLLHAVREGHVNSAFVDVFPDEPRQSSGGKWHNPYEGERRIRSTPHIGAATLEAQPRIARYVARTTQLFNASGALRDCVYMPKANISVSPAISKHVLAVVHADTRGTKKAVDDALYRAGVSNLQSAHVDFPRFGIAYDLSAIDQPLNTEQLDSLVEDAIQLTGAQDAIRSIRMITRA